MFHLYQRVANDAVRAAEVELANFEFDSEARRLPIDDELKYTLIVVRTFLMTLINPMLDAMDLPLIHYHTPAEKSPSTDGIDTPIGPKKPNRAAIEEDI